MGFMHLCGYSVYVYRRLCITVTIHNSLAEQKFCGEKQNFHNSIVLNLTQFNPLTPRLNLSFSLLLTIQFF